MNTASIFIQIASYRDPDLSSTLKNLIENALYPKRLFFGICQQLSEYDPKSWSDIPQHCNLNIVKFDSTESLGAGWARQKAQELYKGEEFILQIDSHMRVIPEWDKELIEAWESCGDPMAILSVYPNKFIPPNALDMSILPIMAADKFDKYGILRFKAVNYFDNQNKKPKYPLPNAFVAGGFYFGPGQIVYKVPNDPEIYFFEEEIAISVRFWTNGFNIYSPNRLIIFHLYRTLKNNQNHSKTHWEDNKEWFIYNRNSIIRVHHLLESIDMAPIRIKSNYKDKYNLGIYGLGNSRSLEDYQTWSGINFKKQNIDKKSKKGIFSNEQ